MFCDYFDDVFTRSNEPILWLKVFLDSRLEYESLEPLIDFLAFLIQKLCQKKNYQPETLECQSNPLKSRTVA